MKSIRLNLEYKCDSFKEFMEAMHKLGKNIDDIDDLFLKSCTITEIED